MTRKARLPGIADYLNEHSVLDTNRNLITVAEAFRHCERIAHRHYENFPVGSLIVPRQLRPHFYAIYAFARIADDIADELIATSPTFDRASALDDWGRALRQCYAGTAVHPVFIALKETVRKFHLPVSLFEALLTAFRQDIVGHEYETFTDLLEYCRCSANPIGRLILLLNGYRDEQLMSLSDRICTALQLTNHWQDLAIDLARSRHYLPKEDLVKFGCNGSSPADTASRENLKRLIELEVQRTRALFSEGRPLLEAINGRLRFEIKLVWQGGMAILEQIERNNYDVIETRPRLTKANWVKLAWNSLRS